MLEKLKKIDHGQHDIYKKITGTLNGYDFSLTPDSPLNQLIFSKIKNFHTELVQLQEKHAQLTTECIANKCPIWIERATTDRKLIPLQYQDSDDSVLKYLTQQFYFFVEVILDCKKISEQDARHLKSAALQIMSRPMGQRLIIKLNQQRKIIEAISGSQLGIDTKISTVESTEDSSNSHSLLGRIFRHFAPNKTSLPNQGTSISKITLHYPDGYHKKLPYLESGLSTPLICSFFMTSISHEFSHCLNLGRDKWGKSKHPDDIQPSLEFVIDQLYRTSDFEEERKTIELAKSGENAILRENGLAERGGHISAAITDIVNLAYCAFFARVRNGEKNFQATYFPSGFSLPCYFEQKDLIGIKKPATRI